MDVCNLFADIPACLQVEQITALLSRNDLKIERIVSRGQASPPDVWYDQDWAAASEDDRVSDRQRMVLRRALAIVLA